MITSPGSKLFDTLIVYLKEFSEENNNLNKNLQTTKKQIYPACKEIIVRLVLSPTLAIVGTGHQ